MNRCRVHYVLSTHWDREWYQTFQDFRYRLVRLMDQILDGLADGQLRGPFQTDGQAIILEDYLEIRPERRSQITDMAQKGMLVIGPWYVLPDEFNVSGESLVRNLRLGRDIARSLGGKPSNAGFVCDMFGHNSQLPQIFAGFGIRGGFIWRGVNTGGRHHLIWLGSDGTRLPCYCFDLQGYGGFAVKVRRITDSEGQLDSSRFAKNLQAYIENAAENSDVDALLLFDGADHQEWDQSMYQLLTEKMNKDQSPYQIVHTSLDEYMEEMLSQSERISTEVEGELREPGFASSGLDEQWVIPGVLSSRVWMKQANSECQTLLCNWAEPFSTFASTVLNEEYPKGFLDVAWRWLLKNHAHDSIGGCSVDQVHEDMRYRFDQARQISKRVTIEATRKIAASVAGDMNSEKIRLVVFNPLPRDIHQVTELTLQIPDDWPVFNEFFGFEPKPAFRIYNPKGDEIPYQRLNQTVNQRKIRLYPTKVGQEYRTTDVKVALDLSIPAMGYTTLIIQSGNDGDLFTRYREKPGLATSECSMANAFLNVKVESNGTLTLTDQRTGQVYSRLLTYEDCADIGDGWYHGIAVNDQTFMSLAGGSEVALVHDGPMLTTFRIRTTMKVPYEFCFENMTRSDRFVDMTIDSFVSLRPEQDYVDVQTIVDNVACDHRLRVLLPSGADASTYLADSPFDVVEREIALRKDNYKYRELEVETKPQQSWTAVFDQQQGLAVVSSGLFESAVRDIADHPIALTLFRGTRRTVFTNGELGGQCLGKMTFHYRIMPLTGRPEPARLCWMGQQISAGLRAVQLSERDVVIHQVDKVLPPTASFLRVEGQVVVSSLRQVDEAMEIRLFNPTGLAIKAKLDTTGWPEGACAPKNVQPVDFESNPIGPAEKLNRTFELNLGSKQIATFRLL